MLGISNTPDFNSPTNSDPVKTQNYFWVACFTSTESLPLMESQNQLPGRVL